VTCSTCSGAGRVRAQQGFFTIERGCPNCGGTGRMVKDPCSGCSGRGRVRNERSLQVTIPPGVENGTRIRLAGEGDAGPRGGPAGDLYIFLSVKPHSIFEREGAHLFCRVPVVFSTAALGGKIEVPTLNGETADVAVPEGTQTGRQFRLKGKGMPVLKSPQKGDLFIEVVVETPQKLNRKQRELLQAFADACDEKTHPQSHGFFARVKDFFDHMGT
jgi:molecular chaperone DnaJ